MFENILQGLQAGNYRREATRKHTFVTLEKSPINYSLTIIYGLSNRTNYFIQCMYIYILSHDRVQHKFSNGVKSVY